jgi:hypothetical protein
MNINVRHLLEFVMRFPNRNIILTGMVAFDVLMMLVRDTWEGHFLTGLLWICVTGAILCIFLWNFPYITIESYEPDSPYAQAFARLGMISFFLLVNIIVFSTANI